MFGHQDDITAQDRKTDVTVQLPDDAIAALTADDRPTQQPLVDPVQATAKVEQTEKQRPTAPSIDGISPAPNAVSPGQLPSSYLEFLGAPGGSQPAPYTTSTSPLTDLLSIKQAALEELSPLVGQLDQTPEEHFKTLIMLIQASDDQTLLPSAYEAAQLIASEKLRAQALLEIVNEVNYFTNKTETAQS